MLPICFWRCSTKKDCSEEGVDNSPETTVKPFLRWAGGKSWLLKNIDQFLPSEIQSYYEPFLGGGAIYFYIKQNHKIQGNIILSDKNRGLINCYIHVRDNIETVIEFLQRYKNEEDFYYQMRDLVPKSSIEKAARFIYLNRTSFNGIYRVNLKGVYNVPYGFKSCKVLSISEMGHILNRTLLHNQAALTISLRPWL